jgi:NAD dependent epimerase/dehydratase
MSKKVLITGAAGFIGSHLCELCVEKGFQVKALIRYNSRNSWGWLETSKYLKEIEIAAGDVRDYDSVRSAFKGCATVYHLAALIGIPYSYISPLAYIKTNVEGTYNILEASRNLSLENVIITSTSEVYGTAQYVPIDENHSLVAQSSYSASKIGADQLAMSYFRSFGLPVKIVRPFNTYGPRQSARAVIPTIISQLLTSKKKVELGNLNPTRDFTYVKDTVNAFLEIENSENLCGHVINVGMNEETSIGALVRKIASLLDTDFEIHRDVERCRPNSSEVERLRCDNKKILSLTNWSPKYNLDSGLLETISWFKSNLQNYKAEIYNV